MPVAKFRRVEDMPPLARVDDSHVAERMRALWGRAFRIAPPNIRPGVRRFRSIDEANAAREQETIERMRASR